jgi:hypothetical protein
LRLAPKALSNASLGQRPRSGKENLISAESAITSESFHSIIDAMPQSLSKVIVHIIFSTKDRELWLDSDVQPRMHAYLATLCRDLGAKLVHVGGVADHIHIVTRCRELFPKLISSSR